MSRRILIEPMIKAEFSEYGDVIDAEGDPDKIINQGLCGRFHNRAKLDFRDGEAGVSLFQSKPRSLPLLLDMMERHPDGSQAFIPMSMDSFLVIVAHDFEDSPHAPRAFQTEPGQAINFHRNIWHGVLTPLVAPGLFAVVDRIGAGANLEEYWFDEPFVVDWAQGAADPGLF